MGETGGKERNLCSVSCPHSPLKEVISMETLKKKVDHSPLLCAIHLTSTLMFFILKYLKQESLHWGKLPMSSD